MRIIDADELIRKMRNDVPIKLFGSMKNLGNVIGIVEDAPTIDAEPTRHGEWKEWWPGDCALIMTGEEMLYECNLCTAKFVDKSRYCPNCGAKMAGGKDEIN